MVGDAQLAGGNGSLKESKRHGLSPTTQVVVNTETSLHAISDLPRRINSCRATSSCPETTICHVLPDGRLVALHPIPCRNDWRLPERSIYWRRGIERSASPWRIQACGG